MSEPNRNELREAATEQAYEKAILIASENEMEPHRAVACAIDIAFDAGYEAGKQELTAELKELREFVGAMHNCVLADGAFCCEVDDGVWHLTDVHDDLLASGTDPFDAWRKMNAGEGE